MNVDKIIEVKNLYKSFSGKLVINDLSFVVKKGTIFGLLGPSGSGKSTTINILTSQLLCDSGDISILGKNIKEIKGKDFHCIGIVGDNSGFYEKLTVEDNLKLYSIIYGVDFSNVLELLKKVGLYNDRFKKAHEISLGMRQRMLLVRAIINNPSLLFLDEPTNGLDPITSKIIYDIIFDLKDRGTTILLTTHNMTEATLLCDELLLISVGKSVEYGSPLELMRKYSGDKKFKFVFKSYEEVVEKSSLKEYINDLDCVRDIEDIFSMNKTLEDVFIEVTGDNLYE